MLNQMIHLLNPDVLAKWTVNSESKQEGFKPSTLSAAKLSRFQSSRVEGRPEHILSRFIVPEGDKHGETQLPKRQLAMTNR